MNSGILSTNQTEHVETKFNPISSWTRFISIIYFINAVIFFCTSFITFFIKRTEGYDSYMISGANSDTIQLLLFVIINIAAIISFMLGYYLIKFSAAFRNAESLTEAISGLEPALKNLKSFFKLFGIIVMSVYFIAIIALLIRIT